jgi:hypothetical protein
MWRVGWCCLWVLLGLAGGFQPSAAQEAAPERLRAWLGLGAASMPAVERDGSLGGFQQLVAQVGGHHLALRRTSLVPWDGTRPDNPSLRELGVLYGQGRSGWLGHASAAIGLAQLRACSGRATMPERCTYEAAIPVVVEGALSLRYVGLGLQFFASFAGEHSHQGIALFVQLGRMP